MSRCLMSEQSPGGRSRRTRRLLLRLGSQWDRVRFSVLALPLGLTHCHRKTTIMLFKMINMELAWYHYGGDVALKPRQLFVTRSQHLADRVRESFSRLHETHILSPRPDGPVHSTSSIGADRTSPAWTSEIPDSFDELKAENFPLFISYDKVMPPPSAE